MLEVAARFHNYSINNQLLIYLQCPDATRVAGYRAWQRLGRQVQKGRAGIQILAPCVYRAKSRPKTPTSRGSCEACAASGSPTCSTSPRPTASRSRSSTHASRLLEGEAPAGMWDTGWSARPNRQA